MGAPKQKWTSEEETALKAGIAKHGLGKWRTISKDPEFCDTLCLRSNVDLKDKWRNMCVGTSGYGSREKAKAARTDKIANRDEEPLLIEKSEIDETQTLLPIVKHDEKPLDVTAAQQKDMDVSDVKPLRTLSGTAQISHASKETILRLENLVLEAITSLKEPRGSNRTDISSYIKDQYNVPLDFQRILSEKLKALTTSGRLFKVNHKYRIAPPTTGNGNAVRKEIPPVLEEKVEMRILTESQVQEELEKLKTMTAKEAAAVAARAVAEAEASLAAAEQAAKEAEAAEADAEAAEAFAEAALITLKNRNSPSMVWCG